jgi:hypothetical protein
MSDRPTPPDPFARKATIPAGDIKLSLSDALSGFAPKPIEDRILSAMPVANIAPDTGRGGGRPRRRGDIETRTKAINFRMRPREQAELNALCDELNRSIPDTIMILIEHYRQTAE